MAGHRCFVIGMVGGIGAGKSTISGIFQRLGAVIIDADKIAHQVLESPELLPVLTESFGPDVIAGGRVSRAALASKVFRDRELIAKLNRLIHPKVITETKRIIAESRKDPLCAGVVLDAPLLFEAGLEGLCDAIVFVEASRDLRAKRMAASRGWDSEELKKRENFQDSLNRKRERADYIIDNNGSLEDAAEQAETVWTQIQEP